MVWTLTGSDLNHELLTANVAVVPSIWPEPFGLVVGEAAKLWSPVVVSAVGGLPEWKEKGLDVWTCPAARPKDLAATIKQVCLTRAWVSQPALKDGPGELLPVRRSIASMNLKRLAG